MGFIWFSLALFFVFDCLLGLFVRHQNGCDALFGSALRLLFLCLLVLPAELVVVITGLTSATTSDVYWLFLLALGAVLKQCPTLAPVFYRARIPSLCSAWVLALSQTVAMTFGT